MNTSWDNDSKTAIEAKFLFYISKTAFVINLNFEIEISMNNPCFKKLLVNYSSS